MLEFKEKCYLAGQFIKQTAAHFISHECFKSAAALSFTTILSIVPVIALLFFSVSQLVTDPENQIIIQNKLLTFFSPRAGEELQTKLLMLAQQASELRTLGLAVLLITAFLALNTVDETINRIWNIKRGKRTFLKLFLYFFALMTLPFLVGISLSVSTYFLSIASLGNVLPQSAWDLILVNLSPLLVTWVAFTVVYKWVPNTSVKLKYAIISGFISATLFEWAKSLFLIYIHHFPTYDLIYGAFSVLPLFFLWVYISWLIVLSGAVLTYNFSAAKAVEGIN
ncbi:hypothetical protein MNBD_GAMMA23-888 [hydrothermal vent metagenome]|uniref:Uncharacterized protein n=1 Tax=hydrothermal vent metagenome TaxID=652676 RepID=A0A3B0ZXC8_9ZZZZ